MVREIAFRCKPYKWAAAEAAPASSLPGPKLEKYDAPKSTKIVVPLRLRRTRGAKVNLVPSHHLNVNKISIPNKHKVVFVFAQVSWPPKFV